MTKRRRTRREIILVGGLHHGLDMLPRAVRWLRDQSGAKRSKPAFIAVEWPEAVYWALRGQVTHLDKMLRIAWPPVNAEVLAAACDSLGWEATAALTAFRARAPIVWLEDGVDLALEKRIVRSPKGHLDFAWIPGLTEMIGGVSSNAASLDKARSAFEANAPTLWADWEAKLPGRRLRTERDSTWAHRILKASSRGAGWGAVFVGAAHATRYDQDTLASILSRRSVRVSRHFLAEPPWLSRTG